MDDEGVSKFVKPLPQILVYSIDENLKPKLAWPKARLELEDEGVCKLVKRLPAVLGYSIEENLESKLAWLIRTRTRVG